LRTVLGLAIAGALAAVPNVRLFPPRATRVHAADVVARDARGEPLRIRCPSCYGRGVRQIYTSMGMRLFPCDACAGRGSVPANHFYRVEVVRDSERTIYDEMAGHPRWFRDRSP
jgi:hypothetical protein